MNLKRTAEIRNQIQALTEETEEEFETVAYSDMPLEQRKLLATQFTAFKKLLDALDNRLCEPEPARLSEPLLRGVKGRYNYPS